MEELFQYYYLYYLPIIILTICHLLFISLVLHKRNFTYFTRATLPSQVPIKSRSSFRFLALMPPTLTAAISAYMAIDVYFLSLGAAICLLPSVIIIIIGYIGFFKELLSSK